jgi:hypothetical protein
LVEERETRRRANVLLKRQMNNSCMLVAHSGTPAPPESREAGAQTPVEATPATPDTGQGNTSTQNGSQRSWWRRMFGLC